GRAAALRGFDAGGLHVALPSRDRLRLPVFDCCVSTAGSVLLLRAGRRRTCGERVCSRLSASRWSFDAVKRVQQSQGQRAGLVRSIWRTSARSACGGSEVSLGSVGTRTSEVRDLTKRFSRAALRASGFAAIFGEFDGAEVPQLGAQHRFGDQEVVFAISVCTGRRSGGEA